MRGVLAAEAVGQSAARPVGGPDAAEVRLARAADLGARSAGRVACGGSRAADVGIEAGRPPLNVSSPAPPLSAVTPANDEASISEAVLAVVRRACSMAVAEPATPLTIQSGLPRT